MNVTSPLKNLQFSFSFKIPAETFKIPEKSYFLKVFCWFFYLGLNTFYQNIPLNQNNYAAYCPNLLILSWIESFSITDQQKFFLLILPPMMIWCEEISKRFTLILVKYDDLKTHIVKDQHEISNVITTSQQLSCIFCF